MAVRLKSAKLDIYIYTGSQENKGDPKYTLTKSRLASEDTITFEISELVRDYIDIKFNGNYEEIEQTAWVQTELTRTFENDTDSSTTDDPEPLTRRYIAFRGYGELYDVNDDTNKHINPTLSKSALISNRTIYHKKDEPLYVPFYRGEDGVFDVQYKSGDSVVTTKRYGGNVKRIKTDDITIRTDNAGDVYDTTTTVVRSDGNGGFTSKDIVSESIDTIDFTDRFGQAGRIVVKSIEECRHTPYKVSFMNKFGAIQDLWFFKRSDRSMDIQRERYNKSTLEYSATGATFETYNSPSALLSSTAKKKVTMNTGFVTEDHNQVIKELLNTEFCWIHNITEEGYIEPTQVKPTDSSFQEKINVNEKLLNFTLQFEYAHNFIQDIR